ncbi:TM1802 family CRISPR-associated protein [Thermus sp.]|uniref:TM1802 family CRISPR-associated protein n=1 Tax=Thermus sp. TaxID=275 RepID=UPI0025D24AFB|nr:TM1802 family CRISPR-associated protein [Thermus sp.]MCS6869695.1 TM1802 family CRISPR-associated protein [Thermus sp.]
MIRQLLRLGQSGGEGFRLEDYVQRASGRLYLLDLDPQNRVAGFTPYELDEEKCARFLWVGDPPASNAPRDRATTKDLRYLLGQVPTKMAEHSGLRSLLQGLLWDPGKPGGKARYLLDLRGWHLQGAKDAEAPPFRIQGGRLEMDGTAEGKTAGELAEALAQVLRAAYDIRPPEKGGVLLFSLALSGKPLAEYPEYRDYLRQRLLQEPFAEAQVGVCHGCGREDRVTGNFSAFRLKFYITDKKSFAPGVDEGAFPRAYALCQACFAALGVGERLAWERLRQRFLERDVLVLPEADFPQESLERLLERLVGQVQGLERLERWKDFLERAAHRQEEVRYLGFSLLFFQRAQAATKAEELVLEVPPSRVEAILKTLQEARERGFPVEGLRDWLFLMPLSRGRKGEMGQMGLALQAVSRIFLQLPLFPKDLLPLWLKTAERVYREDGTLYALTRYRAGQGVIDLVNLGAGWMWVLQRLEVWGGNMEGEVKGALPLTEEEKPLFEAYGFGALRAGLYLLGQAMEAVGQAQARLSEYRKEPLLDSIGWQGMSLVRVRHLVPEVMAKATYYLEGDDRTRVLDLLGRATDLLERSRESLSEREVPYYILMGYAQARSKRLRSGRREEVTHGG